MGNPSNHYTDFENDTQVHQWEDLVQTLAERYIGKNLFHIPAKFQDYLLFQKKSKFVLGIVTWTIL